MAEKIIRLGLELIAILGYPGLFFGLFIEFLGIAFPGEIVLSFAGFLIWNGKLSFIPALLAAIAGSLCGSIVAYYIGFSYGRPFLEKYGRFVFINPKTIDRAERWFNRHGYIVLLLGRFVPGVRPLSSYIAGISKMKIKVFLPLSLVGLLIWCLIFIILGTKLGQNWANITQLLEQYDLLLVISLILLVLLYLFMRFIKIIKF